MSSNAPTPGPRPGAPVRSFIGWAFLISIAIHFVLLPFVKLHGTNQEKEKTDVVSVSKKIKVVVPTPPPPTPTPPPPTPPPKATPPPVKQTAPPPIPKLVVKPPKTTTQSKAGPTERKVSSNVVENQNGVPHGNVASAPATTATAAPASTAAPATPAPTPTGTPKPACAVPNKDAAIKGSAAEPEYPDIARQQGAVGTATVKVTLSASGSVSEAVINKSAGNAALDTAAVAAAKATSYAPEVVNCVPTAGSYLFEADFTGQ